MARREGQYDVCPHCGANIDAGSVCDDCRRKDEARTDGAVRTSNNDVNILHANNTTKREVCQDECSLD